MAWEKPAELLQEQGCMEVEAGPRRHYQARRSEIYQDLEVRRAVEVYGVGVA